MFSTRSKRTRISMRTFVGLGAMFTIALWLFACCMQDAAASADAVHASPTSCCAVEAIDEALSGEGSCCGTNAADNCACGLLLGPSCCCGERKAQGLAACSDSCGCGEQSQEPMSDGFEVTKKHAPAARTFERESLLPDADNVFCARAFACVRSLALGIEPPPPRTVA